MVRLVSYTGPKSVTTWSVWANVKELPTRSVAIVESIGNMTASRIVGKESVR